MSFKGLFITLEGGEGSGKTTILKMIQDSLVNQGFSVIQTREPGGVSISEEIRNIILDRKNTQMDPKTEALLYAASRRQHLVEKVIPALERGEIVISDRYIDSSLVYQGVARGIGIKEVYDLNIFATDNILPDLTLIFDIDPNIGLSRISKNDKREVNRLDLEKKDFHSHVREGYQKIAKMYPDRIKLIDASKSIVDVYHDCMKYIETLLKQKNYYE